ncbi:uncharacterized protein LOC125206926 [Salvia hispanica]|uniref:uncharacterized protein LOC125206926 n=1 Tax=Salvia hispanica TaxID=49212 RepID=UPI002009DB4B|nr:uncharacterized protein LOC125206926 [Salvia hispanica]
MKHLSHRPILPFGSAPPNRPTRVNPTGFQACTYYYQCSYANRISGGSGIVFPNRPITELCSAIIPNYPLKLQRFRCYRRRPKLYSGYRLFSIPVYSLYNHPGWKTPARKKDRRGSRKDPRAQDGILKYMLKLMDVCKARGFVSDIEIDEIRGQGLIEEKDVSDEEIDAEDLEKRMWKDRVRLKRMKERPKLAEKHKAVSLTTDQARRKKMARAQDGILKYMLKLSGIWRALAGISSKLAPNSSPNFV